MEQGIKILEELGYVKNDESSEEVIRFVKDITLIDTLVLQIEKEGFQKLLYECGFSELITLEEAKACIMIMEAMKYEKSN